MSKGSKRKVALLITVITAFSLLVSSCASSSSTAPPSTDLTKAYKFGVNTWGSGVPILDLFGDEAEYAIKTFGMTSIRASDDFTSDKELTNIQNFCSAGVNGIVMQASAITTLPQMAQVCQDAKVPFVLNVFIGNDPDRDKIAETNPYFTGAVDSDMVYDGKVIAQLALEDGCKTALIIGGNIGDNNMDQRIKGFTEEFTAGGGTVVAEARCTDPSESATKAEDMISAHKDADMVYSLVGDYVPGPVAAIEKLGLTGDMKVYASCVDKTTADYIKQGLVEQGNDGICLASSIAPTLLLNYLDGHQILDANGKPPRLQTIPFIVNKDNVDAYVSVFYTPDVHPIAAEVLKSLCYRYNKDVTYQTYVDLIQNGLTLNAILEAHNMPAVG